MIGGGQGGPSFPRALVDRSLCREVQTLSLVLNNVSLADKESRSVLKRLRLKGDGYWHLVRGLHMASCEIGREAMAELIELLSSSACGLERLDLSFTQAEAAPLVQVLRSSASLTALDVRKVPHMAALYQTVGELLLQPGNACKLAYARCDAFELLEGTPALSLRETDMSEEAVPGGLALLAGLLKHNASVKELDLTAADVGPEGAKCLAQALEANTALSTLRLRYNPALDDAAREALREAAALRSTPLVLEL